VNQVKAQSQVSNQGSTLTPRDVSRVAFFGGGGGGGGGSVGWQEVTFADGTAVGQGYGITYAASPVAGFEHRLTIDINSSTNYLSKALAAYVYFDTGQSTASLSSSQSLVMAVRIECSIDPADVIVTDAGADFSLAAFLANDVPNTATMGVWSGAFYDHLLAAPRLFATAHGDFSVDTTIGGGGAQVTTDINNDKYEGPCVIIQPVQTGTGAAPLLGIQRAMTNHWFEDNSAAKSNVTDNNTFQRSPFGGDTGTGNIHVGGMFSQFIRNAGIAQSKTIDFNIRYLLAVQ
jgi:hypothetical protein